MHCESWKRNEAAWYNKTKGVMKPNDSLNWL